MVTDGEWHIQQGFISNSSVELLDGLEVEKDNADVIWSNAEVRVLDLDLTVVARLRVVFVHKGAAGANVHVKAEAIYHDSYTTN